MNVDCPPALRVPAWESHENLVHGFFGRRGGTSEGAWSSLNVSENVGDDPRSVAENWLAVKRSLHGIAIARMRQVHGDHVELVRDAAAPAVEADGLLTRLDGVGLAVLTADCVPILMIEPKTRTAMAVHAGWRGTAAAIAARALAAGQRCFGIEPADWEVALGPAIGGCCYEVSAEIGEQIADLCGASAGDVWRPSGEHGLLDLRTANRTILMQSGVRPERITSVGPCTACAESDLFSHRRSGAATGRQLSIVGWKRK